MRRQYDNQHVRRRTKTNKDPPLSLCIYNVNKRIQEDDLQQLALFSEYARLAVESDNVHEKKEETAKPFQCIAFLVRDWQYFEEEDDCAIKESEMKEYLDKSISERDAKDLQETREQMLACFESLTCHGLCHPGMAVIKKSFTGNVSKIDPRLFATPGSILPACLSRRQLGAQDHSRTRSHSGQVGGVYQGLRGYVCDGRKLPRGFNHARGHCLCE
jgi:hypothetical protein